MIIKVTALYLGWPVLSGQVLDLGGDVVADLAGQGHQRCWELVAALQKQAGDLAIHVGVGANVLGADADPDHAPGQAVDVVDFRGGVGGCLFDNARRA